MGVAASRQYIPVTLLLSRTLIVFVLYRLCIMFKKKKKKSTNITIISHKKYIILFF